MAETEVCPLYCYIPLQPPVTPLNQPQALATINGYHYQHFCVQNGQLIGGGDRKIRWRGKCKCLGARGDLETWW